LKTTNIYQSLIKANLKAMTTINESLLDEHLGKLESARTWSPRVISKLENFIRSAKDY